jgi:hypothetical protein
LDPLIKSRRTGAATDTVDLTPPRHIPTLPHSFDLLRRPPGIQLVLDQGPDCHGLALSSIGEALGGIAGAAVGGVPGALEQ